MTDHVAGGGGGPARDTNGGEGMSSLSCVELSGLPSSPSPSPPPPPSGRAAASQASPHQEAQDTQISPPQNLGRGREAGGAATHSLSSKSKKLVRSERISLPYYSDRYHLYLFYNYKVATLPKSVKIIKN